MSKDIESYNGTISKENKNIKRYTLGALSILLLLLSSYLLIFYLKPQNVIAFLGNTNSYLTIFVTAIFGGFTTFNIIPYHPLLVTLAIGGLNPFLLGILAATGVSIGDSTSYYLGYVGRGVMPQKTEPWFEKIHKISEGRPKLFLFLCFLYSCFIPLSNDLITIPAGLAGIKFWKIMTPLFLGNIFFDVSLAILASNIYSYI